VRHDRPVAGRRSAGVLLFRRTAPEGADDSAVEVLLAHMGGPFWARKDAGAWSLPKGEHGTDEEPEAAARREFAEELGAPPPADGWIALGETRQSGGKVVTAWAVEGDFDPDELVPGTFDLEWPRGSGVVRQFAEVDRVAWFPLDAVGARLVSSQRVFLDRLAQHLAG
jgi:predicted NUDIX family NTP pyrophosphohydrolase